jgi:hypothetical protein
MVNLSSYHGDFPLINSDPLDRGIVSCTQEVFPMIGFDYFHVPDISVRVKTTLAIFNCPEITFTIAFNPDADTGINSYYFKFDIIEVTRHHDVLMTIPIDIINNNRILI